MPDKVQVAIFGNDLRVEYKKHELSKNGNKINIVSSGEGYFMPEIGPTNFLDLPLRKKYLLFGSRVYQRVYFAKKKASKCVDFGNENGIIYGPDEEQVKKANLNLLAEKIGQDAGKSLPWYIPAFLGINTFLLLIIMNVLGVF